MTDPADRALEAELQHEAALEEQLEQEEAGRHATNLELFFDLVFVFAISQLSKLIASDISGTGVLKSALVAWLVWQLWGQFSWLGTSIDLDRDSRTRIAFLSSIFPTLFLAISIPGAYSDHSEQFGLALFFGTVWVLTLQGVELVGDPGTRRPFIQYASLAGIAPVLVLVGGYLDGTPRIVLWCVAAAAELGGALASNRGASIDDSGWSWRIDPVHFAERHGLFVIIVLGEVLVAIGVAASAHDLSWSVAWAVVASAFLAAVVFWAYFGFISRFGEEGLRLGHGKERVGLARDFFTFGHFPLVLGVALLASVIEHVVSHPDGHLHGDHLWLLGTAVVLIGGGFMGLQWRLRRKVAPERPIAIAAVIVFLATAGPHLSAVLTVAVCGAAMFVMQTITANRVAKLAAA